MASRFICATLVALICLGGHVVEGRLGMSATDLTESTFETFVKRHSKVLVDFYDPKDPSWKDGQGDLEAAIRTVRGLGCKVPFAKVDVSKEAALASKYVTEGKYPQLMWFLHGEPTQYHRTLRTAKAIGDFVIALDREAMVPVNTADEARDFVPSVFARVARNTPMFKTLEVVAQKHMDTVAFTFLDDSTNQISWMGLGADPTKYEGAVEVAAIEKWVQRQLLKSEPIPEDPALLEDEGSKVVVGRNFEEIVLQKDKDVILQVYAPWCGHCKQFGKIWNNFAREVQHVPHLVVAKMDGSRNGTPLAEFKWDSYPKIFFVPAGKTTPVHFSGDRTVENLLDFVGKHGSKPIKADSRLADAESVLDL